MTTTSKTSSSTPRASATKQSRTLASYIDEAVQAGGDWTALLSTINKAAKRLGYKVYDKSHVRAHVNYRLSKNPAFLGTLEMTENGISPKKKRTRK